MVDALARWFIQSGRPDYVAERVLAGIRSNDLYILTHPELRDVVAGRFDQILAAFDKASFHEASASGSSLRARLITSKSYLISWRQL